MPNPSTYLLKITLKHIKPSIYRRVVVASDTKLAQLHQIIQVVMGWENYHMHQFIKNKVFYGPDSDDFECMCEPYTKIGVSDLLNMPKDKRVYAYDFGDGRQHEILLEKILPYDADLIVPFCTDGKRVCPPEDCGCQWGMMSYVKPLKTLKSPKQRNSWNA